MNDGPWYDVSAALCRSMYKTDVLRLCIGHYVSLSLSSSLLCGLWHTLSKHVHAAVQRRPLLRHPHRRVEHDLHPQLMVSKHVVGSGSMVIRTGFRPLQSLSLFQPCLTGEIKTWWACEAIRHTIHWKCALLMCWTRASCVGGNFSGSTVPFRNSRQRKSFTYFMSEAGA